MYLVSAYDAELLIMKKLRSNGIGGNGSSSCFMDLMTFPCLFYQSDLFQSSPKELLQLKHPSSVGGWLGFHHESFTKCNIKI